MACASNPYDNGCEYKRIADIIESGWAGTTATEAVYFQKCRHFAAKYERAKKINWEAVGICVAYSFAPVEY